MPEYKKKNIFHMKQLQSLPELLTYLLTYFTLTTRVSHFKHQAKWKFPQFAHSKFIHIPKDNLIYPNGLTKPMQSLNLKMLDNVHVVKKFIQFLVRLEQLHLT